MIKVENGKRRYFDKHGVEITEGCYIKYDHADKSMVRVRKVYMTDVGELGTDATNPIWIENGWAVPCEYGIYPLCKGETEEVEVIKEGDLW